MQVSKDEGLQSLQSVNWCWVKQSSIACPHGGSDGRDEAARGVAVSITSLDEAGSGLLKAEEKM